MTRFQDQAYLLADQYRDFSNLSARQQLHDLFSTSEYGWHQWLFDQFNFPPECRVLELGCGAGVLWFENADRIPEGWDITLSDFSEGMLQDAQRNLDANQHPFRFEIVDAQAILCEDESFDAVIANHMLYHVPDRPKAFSEIHRALRPGGWFYASTVGENHLRELGELVRRFDANLTYGTWENPFTLENGLDQVAEWFSQVKAHRYEDDLVVTEAEPLIAYVLSSTSISEAKPAFVGNRLAEFIRFVEQELTQYGAIHITKDSGIFEAHRGSNA